jgi:hypothetical protein
MADKKKKKKSKSEGPIERGRRLKEEKMLLEKERRDEFYARNPRSVLPSRSVGEGWNAGSEGHMSGVVEPAPVSRFKEGGVVYAKARGAGAATRGTRFRG